MGNREMNAFRNHNMDLTIRVKSKHVNTVKTRKYASVIRSLTTYDTMIRHCLFLLRLPSYSKLQLRDFVFLFHL